MKIVSNNKNPHGTKLRLYNIFTEDELTIKALKMPYKIIAYE